MRTLRFPFLAASVLLFLAPGLQAQASHATIVTGAVTIQHGETGAAVQLDTATPLQAGDGLISGAKSGAVFPLDSANSFELSANTEAWITQIDSAHFRVEIRSGSLTWHVDDQSAADVNVDTPSVTVHPSQVGVYAVTVKPGGESEILPRQGNVQVLAPGGSQWVYAGQKMIARGDRSNPEFRVTSAVSRFTRALILLANVIQAIDIASSLGGGGGGGSAHPRTAGSAKPAPPAPTPHPSPLPPAPPPGRGAK